MLDAGSLNRRITFQKPVKTKTQTKETVSTFVDHVELWAAVSPLRGDEKIAAAQVSANERLQFTIRYRTDITKTMRIKYEGRHFDIKTSVEVGNKEGLRIEAEFMQAKP